MKKYYYFVVIYKNYCYNPFNISNKIGGKMEQGNRRYIAIISFFRKLIRIFFNLFFNIYILKIVNNDLSFIIKYTLFGVIVDFIICYVILKFINSRNAKTIYKASFPLLILNILALLVFKENIVEYIYLFKILERLSEVCYSMPYELIVIGSNNNDTMSSFIANINILSSIATIITPIVSGFIIQKFSYYTLFVLLILETLIIIAISFKIKDFTVSDKKLELRKFFKIIKDKKHIQDIYKCMFYRRISSQGAITELLPIILFLRLGTEMDLGTYNSAFAILSIISLQILKIINNKKIKKDFYPYLAVIIFLSSLLVVYDSSFITLLIYYIFMNSLGTIIESESCSIVYSAIKTKDLIEYKKEHIFAYNVYMTIGQIISYSLIYILYNYFYDVNILAISVSILMFFLIISAIYLKKTANYLDHNESLN